jgi:hypothetical protein
MLKTHEAYIVALKATANAIRDYRLPGIKIECEGLTEEDNEKIGKKLDFVERQLRRRAEKLLEKYFNGE